MEKWKQNKTYPNYEVSTKGKIRNIKTGRILKTRINSRGYEQVCLHTNNIQHTKKIHRLVASTYLQDDTNDINYDMLDINHKDGNKLNNSVDNLEYCSRKYNLEHAVATGLKREPNRIKIKNVETGKIYNSINDCSIDTGCDRSHIRKYLDGRLKTCKGYHFEEI